MTNLTSSLPVTQLGANTSRTKGVIIVNPAFNLTNTIVKSGSTFYLRADDDEEVKYKASLYTVVNRGLKLDVMRIVIKQD